MPNYFKNFIFVSVAVLDSGNFKGNSEMARLEAETRAGLEKYVRWTRSQGYNADYRLELATETVSALETLCRNLAREFPTSVFFTGKLIFRQEKWYQGILHSETARALQRRLQFDGLQTVILPIRATV
jgi:hypothetical protein